jgi:hypothetical protein
VKGAPCRFAVEKDNGIPIMGCRVSVHENAGNLGMAIHLIALSLIKKKVSSKSARFVSEKMKENKPCPQFPARIVHFFIAFLVKLEFCVSKQR